MKKSNLHQRNWLRCQCGTRQSRMCQLDTRRHVPIKHRTNGGSVLSYRIIRIEDFPAASRFERRICNQGNDGTSCYKCPRSSLFRQLCCSITLVQPLTERIVRGVQDGSRGGSTSGIESAIGIVRFCLLHFTNHVNRSGFPCVSSCAM